MSKEIKIPLLKAEDIEVKIKQVTKAGALALIYKTARTDRKYLNMVYGPMNWTSDYKVIKDNLYCGIGVREDSDHDFVWKWDCGIESRSDEDGNEKKGEASDAFKRGGFQWGIGEELYSAPMIWLKVSTKQDNGKWVLENKYARYEVTQIEYNEKDRTIAKLVISNADTGVEVFNWTSPNYVKTPDKKEPVKVAQKSVEEPNKTFVEKPEVVERKPLNVLIKNVGEKVKEMKNTTGSIEPYKAVLAKVATPDFKCNAATEQDYQVVNNILEELIAMGY